MNYEEIFFDDTKNSKKIKKEYYLVEGKYPIIDQGKENIAGYFNEETGIYKSTNPVIIFGDHTRIIKYIDFPFFLGADGVKILKVKNEKFLAKYLYYALLKFKIPNTGYNRHFKWLKNFKIEEIELEKQKKIVEILDKSNLIIKRKKEELKKLEELKKSLFYEMFGDPIRNEKGWEVKKLKNISYVNDKKKILTPKEKYWLLNLEEIEAGSGRIILKKRIKYEDLPSSISYFDKNWILYSKLRPYLNKVVLSDEEGFCTSELIALRPNLEYLTDVFLWKYLMNNTILEYLKIHVSGAKMPRVVMEDFKNLKVVIPPLELQQKFSERIRDVDKLKFTEISSNKSCIMLRKRIK